MGKHARIPRASVHQDTRTRRGLQKIEAGIANLAVSALTTKGDIWVYDTSDSRLPVGANGLFLGADSTQSTGLKWTGAVTSVAMTVPAFLSVAGSPITTSGTLAVTLANQNANTGFLGPASGAAAAPTFRAVDARDLALGADPLTYANPLSISTTNGKELHTVTTTAVVGNATFNAADAGLAGQKMFLQIANDAGGARTITFGTNFKPNGTLVGVPSKTSTIWFLSDGTNWLEQSRTVGVL